MEPFYQDNSRTLYHKDCRDMSELNADSLDLLITDPPYGISFMGKDWDTFNEVVPPQGAYQHKKGFKKLPRQNTASMTEFFVPIWKECLRVLKSGAFAFVMCSPRADVMAKQICCLQDAGFWVNFTPIFWAYASGFPKAQNIGKAVDKRLGTYIEGKPNANARFADQPIDGDYNHSKITREFDAQSPQAKALDGSYGGFQPKPAVEVILVAMKPLSEKTYVDQALKNRKGITWLDDCRIPYESEVDKEAARFGTQMDIRGGNLKTPQGVKARDVLSSQSGRFPANLLVSDDVLNDGKVRKSSQYPYRAKRVHPGYWDKDDGSETQGYTDFGSFSRYFDLDKWWAKTFPFLIVPKASKSEKNKGLDYSPEPIRGRDEGQDIRNVPQKARSTPRINQHPTVKPVKLMAYLIILGSREGDMVLDNFGGTGTTAVAASLLGRKCTIYETEEKYCEIATKRCRQSVMDLSKYSQ